MFEEAVAATIPSIWEYINSWLTPTILFILLNVMIGTIAFTSTLTNQNNISKSQSFIQRVRSICFNNSSTSQEPSPNVKLPPDSNINTLYNHQLETFVNPSHYIFEQPQQYNQPNIGNMQYNYYPQHPQQINPLYDFEHTHQLQTNENPSYYMFQQPHVHQNQANTEIFQENAQLTNTQYFFEQTHEEKAEETDTQYSFEQSHHEKFEEASDQFVVDLKNQENLEEHGEEDDEEVGELQSLDDVYSKFSRKHHISRTKSDTEPASGEIPEKLPTKMRKSASLKSSFGHFEEENIVENRRPATVRERGAKATVVDYEVDAKADEFINKFKLQLKLQRMDSFTRYKDVVNRGSEKKK